MAHVITGWRILHTGCLVVFSCMWLMFAPCAQADDEVKAELQRVRAQVTNRIQLLAAELLDELIHGWRESPPLPSTSDIIIAQISVPLGVGSPLTAFLENHATELITHNPATGLRLVHCPQCTEMVVQSQPDATIVARGLDLPEALRRITNRTGTLHALYLDFEAEGTSLVLRAKITRLEPHLPIVAARTLVMTTSEGGVLRSPNNLVSVGEARTELENILFERGWFLFPVRILIRSYSTDASSAFGITENFSTNDVGLIAPFIWFEAGVETAFSAGQTWLAGFNLGFTSMDTLYEGWSVGARINRLLWGSVRSLSNPNPYWFFGGTVIHAKGPNTLAFHKNYYDVEMAQPIGGFSLVDKPQTTFFAIKTGIELRLRSRFSLGIFLEAIPALTDAPLLGSHAEILGIDFQCFGGEIGLWF